MPGGDSEPLTKAFQSWHALLTTTFATPAAGRDVAEAVRRLRRRLRTRRPVRFRVPAARRGAGPHDAPGHRRSHHFAGAAQAGVVRGPRTHRVRARRPGVLARPPGW